VLPRHALWQPDTAGFGRRARLALCRAWRESTDRSLPVSGRLWLQGAGQAPPKLAAAAVAAASFSQRGLSTNLTAGPRPRLPRRYGSYEHSYDPYFDFKQLSLLDRGWAVGIAHSACRRAGAGLANLAAPDSVFARVRRPPGVLTAAARLWR
jgi:hypothetical protein